MKIFKKILFTLFGFIVGYLSLCTYLHISKNPNKYLFSLYSGLALGLICFLLTFIKSKNVDFYEDGELFRHPFNVSYWKMANKELKSVKNIVMISILLAFMLISKLISLPSGFGMLGIGLAFVFFSIVGFLYGPVAGLIVGFLSDSLGFLLFPGGFSYFFGYTFNAMLAGFIYGISFYKTRITFFKSFIARFFVNILVNAFLGTLWWGIISNFTDFNQYFTYFITLALPKNLAYLIPQSLVIFVVFKALSSLFYRLNLIDIKVKENFTIF